MTTPKVFELTGSNKVFQADVPIKGRDFVVAYISQNGLADSYSLVSQSLYTIVNDAIVFEVAPTGKYLRLIVGSNRAELLNSPSNIANVSTNMDAINYVAENMDAIVDAYSVIATAENINTITSIGNNLGNIIAISAEFDSINNVEPFTNDISIVSDNITKVVLTANNMSKVDILNNNLTNINKVANIDSNVTNVGSNITKVVQVSDNLTNITKVATDLSLTESNINKVGVSINNVNTVGTHIDNVNLVANNMASIVNKAKFKVRSEIAMSLDEKTNPKVPVIVALPEMVGFEVNVGTNSVKNISGRDLDIIGSVAIQVASTATVDMPVYIYSETSTDGVNWSINQSSLRKVKIIKEGTDYITMPSLLVTTKWLNGSYNRFRIYKEGTGAVSITPVSDTVNGSSVVGHSFIWMIHEV